MIREVNLLQLMGKEIPQQNALVPHSHPSEPHKGGQSHCQPKLLPGVTNTFKLSLPGNIVT